MRFESFMPCDIHINISSYVPRQWKSVSSTTRRSHKHFFFFFLKSISISYWQIDGIITKQLNCKRRLIQLKIKRPKLHNRIDQKCKASNKNKRKLIYIFIHITILGLLINSILHINHWGLGEMIQVSLSLTKNSSLNPDHRNTTTLNPVW